jgi:hypothetical protein
MPRTSSIATLLGAALAFGCNLPVTAQAELDTVREMLRLDAERALARERDKLPVRDKPPASAVAVRTDRVAVSAIYGLAGKRTVILRINEERREFREGADAAKGHAGLAGEYRLLRIEDDCVHVAKAASKTARVACFLPSLNPQPKPPVPLPVPPFAPMAMGMPIDARGIATPVSTR